MKSTPLIIALGTILVIAAAVVGYVVAGKQTPEKPSTPPPQSTEPEDTAHTPAQSNGTTTSEAETKDPYLALTDRAADAFLTLNKGDETFTLPPLAQGGNFEWTRTWETNGQAGQAHHVGTWSWDVTKKRLSLSVKSQEDPHPSPTVATYVDGRLTLSGLVPESLSVAKEYEHLARQAMFLLRSWPAGEIADGDSATLSGQPFIFDILDTQRAILVASDSIREADSSYPREAGVLSEIQVTKDSNQRPTVTRIVANQRPEAGVLNIERLDLQ